MSARLNVAVVACTSLIMSTSYKEPGECDVDKSCQLSE